MVEATCEAGVVQVGTVVVEADILSEGNGSSTGVVILDGDKAKYLTSNATDLKDLIQSVCDLVDKIVTIATGLDAVTVSPGTQAANIALLVTAKTALLATKETLK